MLQLLFWSFVVVSSICSIYYLCFLSFANAKQKQLKPFNLPVSVIVCAKNEAQNLKHLIPKLLEQSYLNFELVLINDASFDDTLGVMEYFETKHNHIKVRNCFLNEPRPRYIFNHLPKRSHHSQKRNDGRHILLVQNKRFLWKKRTLQTTRKLSHFS